MIVLLQIMLSVSLAGNALIPNECAKNFTQSKICCPIPVGFVTPCGYPERGSCQIINNVHLLHGRFVRDFREDNRYNWPLGIFREMCKCNVMYDGVDCGRCSSGYKGAKCRHKRLVVRRNIMSYSKRELFVLRSVLNMTRYIVASSMAIEESIDKNVKSPILLSTSIYDSLVFIHQFTARPLLQDVNLCKNRAIFDEYTNHNHNGPGFLTWHRYFILLWERLSEEVAKQYYGVDQFSFPYWDWTDHRDCNVCNNEMVGLPGERNGMTQLLHRDSTFYDWTETCEQNDTSPCFPCKLSRNNKRISRAWCERELPTSKHIKDALELSRYYINQVVTRTEYFKDNKVDVHTLHEPCKSFSSFVEGDCHPNGKSSMHNKVHNMISGTFRLARTSVNDPLFILHHVQIDRIFEYWLRHNEARLYRQFPETVQRESQCYECYMVGFLPPIKHKAVFVTSFRLGYNYDSFKFGLD